MERPTFVHARRHGETILHQTRSKRVAGGLTEIPLSSVGRDQVVALGQRMKHEALTAVHASPLERAMDTARPMADAHRIREIVKIEALRERRFGKIELITDEDTLVEVRKDLDAFWQLPPEERMNARLVRGMETDRQLLGRLRRYFRSLEHGEIIGAATHWDVISTTVLHETGQLISPENAGGVLLKVGSGKIEVVSMEDVKLVKIITHR